jgi:hypothetical protein
MIANHTLHGHHWQPDQMILERFVASFEECTDNHVSLNQIPENPTRLLCAFKRHGVDTKPFSNVPSRDNLGAVVEWYVSAYKVAKPIVEDTWGKEVAEVIKDELSRRGSL